MIRRPVSGSTGTGHSDVWTGKSRMTSATRRGAPAEVPGLAARRIAADILDGVLRRHGRSTSSSTAPARHPGLPALADRDRALTRTLVATVLRRLGTLRHLLGHFLERGLPARRAARRDRAADRRRANPLARRARSRRRRSCACACAQADRRAARYAGLVNAVLRRIARDGAQRLADLDTGAARYAAIG